MSFGYVCTKVYSLQDDKAHVEETSSADSESGEIVMVEHKRGTNGDPENREHPSSASIEKQTSQTVGNTESAC